MQESLPLTRPTKGNMRIILAIALLAIAGCAPQEPPNGLPHIVGTPIETGICGYEAALSYESGDNTFIDNCHAKYEKQFEEMLERDREFLQP
jgi:hypothetical protein